MNSEKVKEIKKGLEVCQGVCNETCPYYTKPCMTDLSKDALCLINELEEKVNTIILPDEIEINGVKYRMVKE